MLSSIVLLTLCVNPMNAQQITKKEQFIKKVNTVFENQPNQKYDSIFNSLREGSLVFKRRFPLCRFDISANRKQQRIC